MDLEEYATMLDRLNFMADAYNPDSDGDGMGSDMEDDY